MSEPEDARRIRQRIIGHVKNALNAEDNDGNKRNIWNDCRYLKYLIALYYAILSPIHHDHSKIWNENLYFTFYRLDKVAKYLQLSFDRTRACEKLLTEQKRAGRILMRRLGTSTYVTLTESGMDHIKYCLDELEDLTMNDQLLHETEIIKSKIDELPLRLRIKLKTDPNAFKKLKLGFKIPPEVMKIINRIEKISD